MNNIKQYLCLEPLDTLFFKGSEPMVAGQNHEVRTVFPPMPSTVIGALRAAIIGRNHIDLKDYLEDREKSQTIAEQYPFLGSPEDPGFDIAGPFFRFSSGEGTEDFFPAPAHWFADIKKVQCGENIRIAGSEPIPDIIREMGLCGNVMNPLWVRKPQVQELKSLQGHWVNKAVFTSVKDGGYEVPYCCNLTEYKSGHAAVVRVSAFFQKEARVGIALESGNRKVRDGHLYTTDHVRLGDHISMIVGLSEKLIPDYLEPEGMLQLGGEQRIVRYAVIKDQPVFPSSKEKNQAMALSTFPYSMLEKSGWNELPRASGPLIRMGGWDMKKKFHKPMTAFLPAGTVIRVGENTDLPFGFIYI